MTMRNQVAILAGGMGTRLKARTGDIPKPLAPLLGIPVLEHLVILCAHHGYKKIMLLTHYRHDLIYQYFGDGHKWDVEISYSIEKEPLGTAGALCEVLPMMNENFLVLYADTYVDINLNSLFTAHLNLNADATVVLHPNDHPHDSDLVKVNPDGDIVAIYPYPHAIEISSNLVNAALYVFNRECIKTVLRRGVKADLAKDLFPRMISSGCKLKSYITPEYIKDMGTPVRIDQVERDILDGLPERLSSRVLREAVFLDRDGTLTQELGYVTNPKNLELYADSSEAIRKLNKAGMLAVCVTNQPVIARGELTEHGLNEIHNKLNSLLGQGGAYLDGIYFCPHHPDSGFSGEVKSLKINCSCRKPNAGMIDRAVADLSIERSQSWMIGDMTSDIKAGKISGLKTILLQTGYAGEDRKYKIQPDYFMPDLTSAVNWILEGRKKMASQLISFVSESMNTRLVLIGGLARAGKSCAAMVMAEIFNVSGRNAHVLSIDGWLKPVESRIEGAGVLDRYNLDDLCERLYPIIKSKKRVSLEWPIYDRKSRSSCWMDPISIGPQDIILLEGVPALMDVRLREIADTKLFINVDMGERLKRIEADYKSRGECMEAVWDRITSREGDENPGVIDSAQYASLVIVS